MTPTPLPSVGPSPGGWTAPPVAAQARLVVAATQAPCLLPAGKAEWLIGREDMVAGVFPDVDVSSLGTDVGGVSRRHCIIRQQGNQYTIEDLASTNHTYVNKVQLPANVPQPLNHGDEVRLGRLVLNFYVS